MATDYTKTDHILRFAMVFGLVVLALMHVALIRYVSIQPTSVLQAIDERLEVTPKQVMERLDRIEAEHMNYVKQFRETKDTK